MRKYKNIVIGGAIASGKSSIIQNLRYEFGDFNVVDEFDKNDNLIKVMLQAFYDGDKRAKKAFQFLLLETHFAQFEKAQENGKNNIFDRSIFDHTIFAQDNLGYDIEYAYYYTLWSEFAIRLFMNYEKPFYIILDIDYDNFKERLFSRNRKQEIDNYDNNKAYFKHHVNTHVPGLIKLLEKYKIEYVRVDANKNAANVYDQVKKIIKERSNA